MVQSNNRHRPGYHKEREDEDKKIRREAKVIQWDIGAEEDAREAREFMRYDLKSFCKSVMPNAFPLEFGEYHLSMIAKMQKVILQGGNSADAMPRGSGKSTLATAAFIWAVLFGHRRYGAIIGNESEAAKGLMESVKTEIWLGEGIGKYWPKLQKYIKEGDGQSQKFRHMLNSDQTPPLIKWSTDLVRFPSTPKVEEDEWSGGILQACGITGRIRGMQTKLDDGTVLRPDFVLIDDPQTRESAGSFKQTNDREATIDGDIKGLAGPGKNIAAFMAMTVIYPHDLACHYLDPVKHPEWQADKVPMIVSWPEQRDELWQEYNMMRVSAMREKREPKEAWEFYERHREEMDKGAKVYWEDRKYPTDISGLQHAMNLYFDNPNAFLAEYQNEPIEHTGGRPYIIEEMTVMEATNGRKQLSVPDDAQILVSFTDINYSGLNTVILASTNDAVRYVVDYQTYPGNGRPLYDPKDTLKKNQSDQLAIARALDVHIPAIAAMRYMRNGKLVRPDLVLIDCGAWMDLVFRWCDANRHKIGVNVFPSRGRAYNKYRPSGVVGKPGDNWHVADWEKRGRVLVHNADEWRMRTQKAFLLPGGTKGSVTLFGDKPTAHKRFADEVCAEVLDEYIEATEGGNQFFKWGKKVGVANDLLDALVGAVVATSYLGASESGLGAVPYKKQKRPSRRKMTRIKI